MPDKAEIKNVPFYAQQDYECGPAALAMVFSAAGVDLTPQQLVEQVYLPGRKGALQIEMLAASRRHGMVSFVLQGSMDALLREVAAGHPVIVFQNLSLPIYPVWHYAVLIGFDRERRTLLLHSGITSTQEMSFFTFEQTWARAGHWAMVALPPDRLPATAEATTMVQSIAALERIHPRSAQTAYATALKRWPQEHALLLGAGNAAYALRDLPEATDAYRLAVQRHPDFAQAWNNLAQTLLEQGRRDEAAAAISKAVSIGGERLPSYLGLQRQILQN